MSRGLGKVQQGILKALVHGSKRADVIAGTVYQTERPTQAQIVAVRRAIRALEKQGFIECGEFNSYSDKVDNEGNAISGLYLFAWLPGNKPDVKPTVRFNSSEIKDLIIESLARHGVSQSYYLSRGIRRKLKELYGFDSYLYVPQYNRALHQLEKQNAIRRFHDEIWGEMIELTINLLSVTT